MTESTISPLSGLWKPRPLRALYYGPDCVSKHLLSELPTSSSKAFIITGSSLANKTPLIRNLEALLTSKHHAGTFSNIGQHAPVAQLDEATDAVAADKSIDTLISVGGGSPIDSAKAISYRLAQKTGNHLHHLTIPTTLSAAECTTVAGFTGEDGVKTAVVGPELAVAAIFYDATYAAHTPRKLWLATGLRAVDHSVELQYQPYATAAPCRAAARDALTALVSLLPRCAAGAFPDDADTTTRCLLAAYMSLGMLGQNFKSGLGLSHALGYALGSPYGIPHGETSCLTLGSVVRLKAATGQDWERRNLAECLPGVGGARTGDDEKDAKALGDRIDALVKELGLNIGLKTRGIGEDQVDLIAKRATGGQESGELFDRVKELVKTLYY